MASGDYALIGSTLQIVGEQLCEALDLRAGQRVLDVAAGNGNVSLAAARRWCEVTATDYVPALLARAKARAEANGLSIVLQEADAEKLPFNDAGFDVITSTFGVMFTPDQKKAAAEVARVCRPGGKIGLANWTPQGFVGEMFQAIGRYAPPPAAPDRRFFGGRATICTVCSTIARFNTGVAARLHVSLSLRHTLHRYVPHLLWSDGQSFRGA